MQFLKIILSLIFKLKLKLSSIKFNELNPHWRKNMIKKILTITASVLMISISSNLSAIAQSSSMHPNTDISQAAINATKEAMRSGSMNAEKKISDDSATLNIWYEQVAKCQKLTTTELRPCPVN